MSRERVSRSKKEDMPLTPPLVPRKPKKKKWVIGIIFLLTIMGVIVFFRAPILNRLKDIPIIMKILPNLVEEENVLSNEELNTKVKNYEAEIDKLKSEVEALQENNTLLYEKNESLKQYELMYTDFIIQKEAWDEEIAKTNTDLFIKQFESIYPDTAERIYQTLKAEKILSDEQKALSKTIENMDEEQAAKALALLIPTDSELIQVIFNGMSTNQRAQVLSAMTSEEAAQVIKLISPDES